MNQCYFYINREEKKTKVSSSCELDLTGAEVFRWAAVKSPESLNIYCYYTTNVLGSSISSSDSDPATVTVLGEIFHCCSSVLETVIAVFLLTMYYFTLIDLRNPSPVSDDDDDTTSIGHFWTGWILFIKTLSIDCKSTYHYLEGTYYYT